MINILIDRSGKTSKENIFLGNQHENLDETLHFSFPKEYDNFYKYITYSYTNNGCRITGISPLVDDNFIITSKITKCAGVWELNLICKISPVNLDDKVIDLTENNSTKEHIFISNTISACVSGNSIDVEAFNNVAVDENIASLYDSVLALKNRVEENDKLHEQNEAIRKANELERQEAETTRKANESERVSAEQLRVEAENTRKADETKRQSNESARIEAETNRDTAESERVNAENQRAEAEIARQSAETNRASAENKRASAEANRDNAENERVNAETSRKQAESARVSAETARTQAEANRVETEKVRVSAENAREQAEHSRVNAESQRVTAEATRESAERARVEAESAREQAEQSRVNAENLRVEAENKRDSVITKLREDLDANTKADGRTQRSLTALWDLNKGISYKFEDDIQRVYQKTVPTGAKLGSVINISGRTIVFNQYSTMLGQTSLWSENVYNYKDIKKLSNHKLYVKYKYTVKNILDSSKDNYLARLIIFGDTNVTIGYKTFKIGDITIGKTVEHAEIVQAPNNVTDAMVYCIGDDVVGKTVDCNTWVNIIDLTQMFGSGNEPSTVEEFEAMFTEDYYPYNEGTLMSMGTSEVVEQGKNYFDFSKLPTGDTMNVGGGDGASTSKVKVDFSKQTITIPPKTYYANTKKTLKDLCPNITPDTYIITMNRSNIDNNGFIYLYDNEVFFHLGTPRKLSNADLNSKVIFYNSSSSENENVISNIQIEKASTATTYAPYQEKTFTIPQAILNLEGYGWGVGTAYNYVDYTSKTFHKCVGKYTVTGNEYFMSNENLGYIGANSSNAYIVKDLGHKQSETTNSISNKLTRVPYNWSVDSTYNTMEFNGTQLHIRILNSELGITSEATTSEVATAVKNYCKKLYDSGDPIVIYYELATPIVTDISDIIGDTFQEPFEVEPNGSLTFKNVNGDGYRLAVPSHVKYTIKLSEVQ